MSSPDVLPERTGGKPKVSARRRPLGPCAAPSTSGDREMNEDRIEGNWKQVKGKVREQWGKLTNDDLDVIAGKRDQLLGRIQERHGIAKDEAERQVEAFERRNPDFKFEKSQ
jgi:uncharacterized protein YjbJ (UPF0337 family)